MQKRRSGPTPRVPERVDVRLTGEQLHRLDAVAERLGSSRAEVIRQAIRLHLDEVGA